MKYKTDDQISQLTITGTEIKNGRKYLVCKCKCGTVVTRRPDYITRALKIDRVLSCGCSHPNTQKVGTSHSHWCGEGELSGFYFATVKCRANKKKIPFEITIKDAWQLYVAQNGECVMTGLSLSLSQSHKYRSKQTASLDRIDSTKGYILGNIQWVHKTVNLMKNTLNEPEFIKFCKLVAKHKA